MLTQYTLVNILRLRFIFAKFGDLPFSKITLWMKIAVCFSSDYMAHCEYQISHGMLLFIFFCKNFVKLTFLLCVVHHDVVDWFNKSYFTYTCARLRGFFQIEHGFFYFSWNQLIKISKKKFVKLTLIFDANNLTKKKYLTQCWWNEKFNLTKKYFVKSTLL